MVSTRVASRSLGESDAGSPGQLFADRGFKRGRNAQRRVSSIAVVLLLAALAGSSGARAQIDAQPVSGRPAAGGHDAQETDSPKFTPRMLARVNDERQKELVADTAKLLALAQQLQAEVDKSNKDQLSVSVVKKAEEIEKLARSVKDKMRGN